MIPREVATFGRYAARRTGLDPEDGESIAGETWAAYPTQDGLWRTITLRRCIDEARRRHGERGQHRDPLPILDVPIGDTATPALELAGAEDPNLEQAENRADLATILANLDDHDLAALARHYWLGIPSPKNSPAAVDRARALRRACAATRPTPPKQPPKPPERPQGPLTRQQARVLQLAADGNTNDRIAAELVLSLGTVKGTLARAMRNLEANDRAHAVANAIRAGLIA